MIRKKCLFAGLLFLSSYISLYAQRSETDAFNLTNTGLGGTARSISMGGAFGALGGDLSVISNNPAGLGIYRSSEASGTVDLSVITTSTNWSDMKTNQSKVNFSPGNFGIELFFPTSSDFLRNWNIGLSYNRLKNFNRKYRMESKGQPHSISSYIATRASNAYKGYDGYYGIQENVLIEKGAYSPYNNGSLEHQWLSILGYESGMFGDMVIDDINDVYQSSFGYEIGDNWGVYPPTQSLLSVVESGAIEEYNIGFGMNISDFLFLGLSASVTDIGYKYQSGYEELFGSESDAYDHLYLNNWLNTEGTATSVNIGAIFNLRMFRLGVAYNSPRWYNMTDYYDARGGTYISFFEENPRMEAGTPKNSFFEYNFRTPGKWLLSGAVILGRNALISIDYERMDYSKMKYSKKTDHIRIYSFSVNSFIKEDYISENTLKIGAEIKINPQLAFRAGFMTQSSPMRKQLFDNKKEVVPYGTIPHFTVTSESANYFTLGAGYRFTPNFFIDMAFVLRNNNSKSYAFSNTFYLDEVYDIYPITSEPAKLTTNTTRLVLTAGYKF